MPQIRLEPAASRPLANPISDALLRSLASADERRLPFRHWRLATPLPPKLARQLGALPIPSADVGDGCGRRANHNGARVFFTQALCATYPPARGLIEALSDPSTLAELEATHEIDLAGSYLRVEYCQDRDGFWLEPHTDIGAKVLTLQIYLSRGPGAGGWGTDLFESPTACIESVPAPFNSGLSFVPGPATWHGFRRRPITGLRRSIIVNYVKPEWQARHELARPEQPIAAAGARWRPAR